MKIIDAPLTQIDARTGRDWTGASIPRLFPLEEGGIGAIGIDAPHRSNPELTHFWRKLTQMGGRMRTEDESFNPTKFRFSDSNTHNRDVLEWHAEKAFFDGAPQLAAAFAQAAALYAIAEALSREDGE